MLKDIHMCNLLFYIYIYLYNSFPIAVVQKVCFSNSFSVKVFQIQPTSIRFGDCVPPCRPFCLWSPVFPLRSFCCWGLKVLGRLPHVGKPKEPQAKKSIYTYVCIYIYIQSFLETNWARCLMYLLFVWSQGVLIVPSFTLILFNSDEN